jgi:hypothetical protein
MKTGKDGAGWSVFILDDRAGDWMRVYHYVGEHAYQRCQLFSGTLRMQLVAAAQIADEWRVFKEALF